VAKPTIRWSVGESRLGVDSLPDRILGYRALPKTHFVFPMTGQDRRARVRNARPPILSLKGSGVVHHRSSAGRSSRQRCERLRIRVLPRCPAPRRRRTPLREGYGAGIPASASECRSPGWVPARERGCQSDPEILCATSQIRMARGGHRPGPERSILEASATRGG
jgi:hypothetical protein